MKHTAWALSHPLGTRIAAALPGLPDAAMQVGAPQPVAPTSVLSACLTEHAVLSQQARSCSSCALCSHYAARAGESGAL